MARNFWGSFLLLALSAAGFNASGQQHNLGLYVKESQTSTTVTYKRVWSVYSPAAYNEPFRPGDFYYFPPGSGPWCDPETGICYEPDSSGDGDIRGFEIEDRIQVICGWRCSDFRDVVTRIKTSENGGGNGSGGGPDILRPMVPELPFAGPCDQNNFNPNLSNFLTEDQIQRLVNFLNSPAAAQTMWTESRYTGVVPSRRETAGFVRPDGTFEWAQTIASGPCGVTLDYNLYPPGSLSGVLIVHTHPYRRGDSMAHCPGGGLYEPGRPSNEDFGTLTYYAGNNGIGVILDADGFAVFKPNGEWHYEEQRCGFNRMQ